MKQITEQNAKWSSRQKKKFTLNKCIQIKAHYLISVTVTAEYVQFNSKNSVERTTICMCTIYTGSALNEDNIQYRHYSLVFVIPLFLSSSASCGNLLVLYLASFFVFFFWSFVSILHFTCLPLKYWSPELISQMRFYYTVDIFSHMYFWSTEFHLGNQPVKDWRLLDVYISPSCFCYSHKQIRQTNKRKKNPRFM